MSQRKSETARLNGSKSKGPKTPEGKARSSRNAMRHGLTAQFPLLDHESKPEFEAFLDAYIDRFRPADAVELDLVQTMAIARWRLRRIAAMETALFENKILTSEEEIDEEFDSIDDNNRLAWVFDKMASESKALSLLMRYEASLNRLYERAAKQLKELQSSVSPNEPIEPASPQERPPALAQLERPAPPVTAGILADSLRTTPANDSQLHPSRLKPV